MLDGIKERIKKVMRDKGTNPFQLSKGSTSIQQKFGRQINGDSMVTYETIMIILDAFPDVSAEWLMRGEGSMVRGKEERAAKVESYGKEIEVLENRDALFGAIRDAMQTIRELQKSNEELRKKSERDVAELLTRLSKQ